MNRRCIILLITSVLISFNVIAKEKQKLCPMSSDRYADLLDSEYDEIYELCYLANLEREAGGDTSKVCSEPSMIYQGRYESDEGRGADLACFRYSLEREMSGEREVDCPESADYYKRLYELAGVSGDLVCYKRALDRQ